MINALERKFPLTGKGPAFVNWSSILTGIITTILITVFWAGWERVYLIYALPERVAAIEASTAAQLPEILDELRKLGARQQALSVITGTIIVTDGDVMNEPSIWLNIEAPSIRYEGTQTLKLTNMSGETRRSCTVTVKGTVSNPDTSVLGEINSAAGVALRAEEGDRIRVKLEPPAQENHFPYR